MELEEYSKDESRTERSQHIDYGLRDYDCVMNSEKIFQTSTMLYDSYTCLNCVNIMGNICSQCMFTCHKDHHVPGRKLEKKIVNIKNQKCDCAMLCHQVAEKSGATKQIRSLGSKKVVKCSILELIYDLEMEFVLVKKDSNEVFCPFCVSNCVEAEEGKTMEEFVENAFEKKEKYKFVDKPACSCTNELKHSSLAENVNCFENLLESQQYNKYFNKSQLPGRMLKDRHNVEKYFGAIIGEHSELEQIIDTRGFPDSGLASPDYPMSIKLMYNLAKFMQGEHIYVSNPELYGSYSTKFLTKLLGLKVQTEAKFIDARIYSLNFFRNLYVKPLLKYKPFRYLGRYENTSPFHRLMLIDTFDEFLAKLKTTKTDFKRLVDLIYKNVNGYYEKCSEMQHSQLLKEYVKLVSLMVPVKFVLPEDKEFFKRTVERVQKALQMISKNKTIVGLIQRSAQKLFYDIMVTDSDRAFYDRIIVDSEEKEPSSTYSFVKTDYNFTKLKGMFCFDKEEINQNKQMQHPLVYSLLVEEEDFFSSSVERELESKEEYLFEDMIRIDQSKAKIEGVDVSKLMEKVKELEKIKRQYLEAQLNSEKYCESVISCIEDLTVKLKAELEKEHEFGRFRVKVALIKENFLNGIFSVWFNFNKYEHMKVGISKLFDAVQVVFLRLSEVIIEGSPFFAKYFMNNKTVDFILEYFLPEKLDFYKKLLKEFKNDNSTIFNHHLVSKLKGYLNKENVYEDEDKLVKILKLTKLSLKTATEDSKPIIMNYLREILQTALLDSERLNTLIEQSHSNPTEYTNLTALFKAVNCLNLNFFVEINKSIPSEILIRNINNPEIDIKLRKLFTTVYMKANILLSFSIQDEGDYGAFDKHKSNIKEFLDSQSPPENRESKNSVKDFSEESIDSILGPIYINLEKYPVFCRKLEDLPQKYFVKYFRDTVLNPTYYGLYRIIFFAENISAKLKYNVFKLVYLFFECYRYFLTIIKQKNYDHGSFKWFFNGFESKTTRQINSVITVIISEIERNVKEIKSKEFEKMNIYKVLAVINKHLEDFVVHMKELEVENEVEKNEHIDDETKSLHSKYTKSKEKLLNDTEESGLGEEENEIEEEEPNSFYKQIKKAIEKYAELKGDTEENVLSRMFEVTDDLILLRTKSCFISEIMALIEVPVDTDIYYVPKNNTVFRVLNKLVIIEPDSWQDALAVNSKFARKLIISISRDQIPYLFKLVLVNYIHNESNTEGDSYLALLEVIEFMRLLCENHNKIYQTWIFNKKYKGSHFLKFMLDMPTIAITFISHFKERRELLFAFKPNKPLFFKPLIEKLTEFYIEISQGAIPHNFDVLTNLPEFKQFIDAHYRLIDLIENEPDYEMLLSHFLSFIVTYIEENTNKMENKASLIKMLNPKKLQVVMIYAFRKLYGEYKDDGGGFVPEGGAAALSELYLANEDFKEDDLFELTSNLFIYFKMAASTKHGFKCQRLLEGMGALIGQDLNKEKFKNILVTKRELFVFFDKLIRNVEIFYKTKENMEEGKFAGYCELFEEKILIDKMKDAFGKEQVGVNKVIFLTHPDSQFLNKNDIFRFIESSPVDDFNSKLDYILEYYDNIMDAVNMRKFLWKFDSSFLKFLFQLDIWYVEVISACLAIVINVMQMDTIRMTDSFEIENKATSIHAISFVHISILSFFVAQFWIFSFAKLKQFNSHKDLDYFDFISILWHKDIVPLTWSLVVGLLANLHHSNFYLYSLQLFPIFNLFSTMRTVIYSVHLRYMQFISTTFLIIILILLYSSLSYYFFQDEFYNDDIKENLCESYFSCFFMMLNIGVRSGSIGFQIKSESDQTYWSEFLFEWVFFFTIILVMLNIINGIIVDTFQALREQDNEKDDVLRNVCYICSFNRSVFEMNGINFNHHRENDHSILNYYHYLIKITLTDEQDLNSLDSMVLKSFQENKADFFPVKKAICLE